MPKEVHYQKRRNPLQSLQNHKTAVISDKGVLVNGVLIEWTNLLEAIEACAEMRHEGTRAHDDLTQAYVSYLPSIRRNINYDGEESGLRGKDV